MKKKTKKKATAPAEAQKPERDINAERVEAYVDLENSIFDRVNMGTIAVHLDCAGKRDLAAFALHQLLPMLVDLKKRYYANLRNEAPAQIPEA
jgi:hypothetical protein